MPTIDQGNNSPIESIQKPPDEPTSHKLKEIPSHVSESIESVLKSDHGIDAKVETIIVASSEKYAQQISNAARLAQLEVQMDQRRTTCHSLQADTPLHKENLNLKEPVVIFFRPTTVLPGHFREDFKLVVAKINETLTLFDRPPINLD